MKKVAVVALAAVLVASLTEARRPKWHELTPSYSFTHYSKDFGKKYKADELPLRERLYNDELKRVLAHNARPEHTWRMGVNHMSDWTAAEKRRVATGAKPKDTKKPVTLAHKPRAHVAATTNANQLPFSVDWRKADPPVLTAVKDQGQCGSCWAHATTEGVEAVTARVTGQRFEISQQQITSCTPDAYNGCEGNWPKVAWSYVIGSGGVQQDWVVGYQSYGGFSPNCTQVTPTLGFPTPVFSVGAYAEVTRNSRLAFQDALAREGPLSIVVDAGSWSPYEAGIFNGCVYNSGFGLDHAVQAVGYGHDDALGQDYWIVRNSWNAGWGEQGYIRLLREPVGKEQCGWVVGPTLNTQGQNVTVCGQCGLYMEALYGIMNP